jgi:hypothetical protein
MREELFFSILLDGIGELVLFVLEGLDVLEVWLREFSLSGCKLDNNITGGI